VNVPYLTYILKNARDDKVYVICILPQLKTFLKKHPMQKLTKGKILEAGCVTQG
jgi:hypothetical protein